MPESVASVPATVELEDSFHYYRGCYENDGRAQSIEAEGLFDIQAFDAALSDPRSSILSMAVEGSTRHVPLLTPLENASWFNTGFYERYNPDNGPAMLYSHLSELYGLDRRSYLRALDLGIRRLADTKGILALDYSDHEAETVEAEIDTIASSLGVTLRDVNGPYGQNTPHFHYASRTEPYDTGSDTPTNIGSLYDAYNFGLSSGLLTDEHVTLIPSLTESDTEQLWSFYHPVFDKLSDDDPVNAGFNEQEFRDLMSSPDCYKFLYKAGAAIVNLCLLTNIKDCSWMNQFYYRQNYRDKYDQGRVLCSPGVIANPNQKQRASSLFTMGLASSLIRLSGIEPVITFACDTESNKQVPKLSQHSLKSKGMRSDFTHPIGHQLFRMFRVEA
jgi:hypothetical protein